MYSREKRMKAIELYIKYGKSAADVIRELGYPDRKTLPKWYRIYLEEQKTEIVPSGELRALSLQCENEKIYGGLSKQEVYIQAILDYISGMTDRSAIKLFNELITY